MRVELLTRSYVLFLQGQTWLDRFPLVKKFVKINRSYEILSGPFLELTRPAKFFHLQPVLHHKSTRAFFYFWISTGSYFSGVLYLGFFFHWSNIFGIFFTGVFTGLTKSPTQGVYLYPFDTSLTSFCVNYNRKTSLVSNLLTRLIPTGSNMAREIFATSKSRKRKPSGRDEVLTRSSWWFEFFELTRLPGILNRHLCFYQKVHRYNFFSWIFTVFSPGCYIMDFYSLGQEILKFLSYPGVSSGRSGLTVSLTQGVIQQVY